MRATAPLLLLLVVLAVAPAFGQTSSSGAGTQAAVGSLPWSSLNAEQKRALAPLANHWRGLSSDQQRKWVALSHNFNRMSPDEQTTLQGRMAVWAQLTAAQRTQARLNFYEVRRVPADEKRAKWEEYQALPAEERERLAGDRPKAPAGAAPALRPAPRTRVLRPTEAAGPGAVASSPAAFRPAAPVNRNTLLPQPPASVASTTTR